MSPRKYDVEAPVSPPPRPKPPPFPTVSPEEMLAKLREYRAANGYWPDRADLITAGGWNVQAAISRLVALCRDEAVKVDVRTGSYRPADEPPDAPDAARPLPPSGEWVPPRPPVIREIPEEPPMQIPEVKSVPRNPNMNRLPDAEIIAIADDATRRNANVVETVAAAMNCHKATAYKALREARRSTQTKVPECRTCKDTGIQGGGATGQPCWCSAGEKVVAELHAQIHEAGRQGPGEPIRLEPVTPAMQEERDQAALLGEVVQRNVVLLLVGPGDRFESVLLSEEDRIPKPGDDWPLERYVDGLWRCRVWRCIGAVIREDGSERVMVPVESVKDQGVAV